MVIKNMLGGFSFFHQIGDKVSISVVLGRSISLVILGNINGTLKRLFSYVLKPCLSEQLSSITLLAMAVG